MDSQSRQERLAYWMDGSDLGGVTQSVFNRGLKLTARWRHTAPSAVTLLPTSRWNETQIQLPLAGPALTAVKVVVVVVGGRGRLLVIQLGGRLFVVPTGTI